MQNKDHITKQRSFQMD